MLCLSLRNAKGERHPQVVGRTFDLKAAYKQFGLRMEDRDLLRIAVTDPARDAPVLVGLNALPFGGWVQWQDFCECLWQPGSLAWQV